MTYDDGDGSPWAAACILRAQLTRNDELLNVRVMTCENSRVKVSAFNKAAVVVDTCESHKYASSVAAACCCSSWHTATSVHALRVEKK